jgi:excisionase family DNA binding protein
MLSPSDEEALLAREISQTLAEQHAEEKSLRLQVAEAGRELTTLDLPPTASRLLIDILKELAAGNAVTLVPTEAEITTQQAADLLNVSLPYLLDMIEKGILATRMVGSQQRLPLRDVLAYKRDKRAKRLEALAELSALDQELGLR